MPGLPARTPTQLVGDLLTTDPDAASLLSEADHWDRLAAESGEAARRSAREVQASRRRSEELRHRLDPRSRRPVPVSVGLAVLATVTGCLLILDRLQLDGTAGRLGTLHVALCATATWLMAAWTAAVAGREGRRRTATLITIGASTLSALMAAVHVLQHPARATHAHQAALSAIVALLITVLTAGAGVLIFRMEPWTVATSRFRWHHAARQYRRKARQAAQDAVEAASARRDWLRRVQLHAISALADCPQGDDQAVNAALEVAAALHGTSATPAKSTRHPPSAASGPRRPAPRQAPKSAGASQRSGLAS